MTYFTLSTGFTDPEFPAASASTKFCGVHCMRLRLIIVWRVYPLHDYRWDLQNRNAGGPFFSFFSSTLMTWTV
ncbi:MAG: hypothetical protein V7661_14785 [Sulfitobacter sp.]